MLKLDTFKNLRMYQQLTIGIFCSSSSFVLNNQSAERGMLTHA